MNIRKLNKQGFSHQIILVAFVVVFAISGVGYLVAGHASSKKCRYHTYSAAAGSHGHCVKAIQIAIRVYTKNGKYAPKVDGQYGNQTAKYVKRKQHNVGLKEDGIVGPKTWPVICRDLLYWSHAGNGSLGAHARQSFSQAGCNGYYK